MGIIETFELMVAKKSKPKYKENDLKSLEGIYLDLSHKLLKK